MNELNESEICREYRQAKNKNAQIKVLAELNAVKPEVITDILARNGEISGLPKAHSASTPAEKRKAAPIDWSVMDKEVQKLAQEGMSAVAIAERLGIDVQKIYDRRHYYKKQADKLCAGAEIKPPRQKTDTPSKKPPKRVDYGVLPDVVMRLRDAGFTVEVACMDLTVGEVNIQCKTER